MNGTSYVIVVSGSISKTYYQFGNLTQEMDAFYCISSSDGQGVCQSPETSNPTEMINADTTANPSSTLGSRRHPEHVAPAYELDHEYAITVRFPFTGKLRASTKTQCGVGQTACSGAGYTLKVYTAPTPRRRRRRTPTATCDCDPDAHRWRLRRHQHLRALSDVARKVEISRGGAVWERVTAGTALAAGDRIHTGFKSGVTITFTDGSTVRVGPMSLLEIRDVSRNANGSLRVRLGLRLGDVRAQINRSTGAASDFNVQTPTTTASVRGTIFSVSFDGTETVVRVTESSVLVTSNSGASVIVAAGSETHSTATAVSPPVLIGKGPSGAV